MAWKVRRRNIRPSWRIVVRVAVVMVTIYLVTREVLRKLQPNILPAERRRGLEREGWRSEAEWSGVE